MSQMVRTLARLDYNVIWIHLNLFVNHVMEDGRHSSHISSTGIFDTKWHHPISIYTQRCNECYVLFILFINQNLLILPCNNPQTTTFHAWHNYQLECGYLQRKIIVWACFLETFVVNTNSDLPIFLGNRDNIGQLSRILCHFCYLRLGLFGIIFFDL